MIRMLRHEKEKKFCFFGLYSLVIGTIQWLVFMSNFVRYTPIQNQDVQEAYILLPIFLAPFGMLFAYANYRSDEMSKSGMIINVVMFLLPFLYIMLGKFIAFL
ncbi:hypothetical protein ACFOU2_11225 [Bacillus songklensis]|uniref:ABC transporter permease n=1 Tax=Bacillus songklensis TaxID=1069116 RepID=A0ABV8B331_9BACI